MNQVFKLYSPFFKGRRFSNIRKRFPFIVLRFFEITEKIQALDTQNRYRYQATRLNKNVFRKGIVNSLQQKT